ncbi:MAG: ATP F0F1 synthase subunit B [Pseudomonadota bacterium]
MSILLDSNVVNLVAFLLFFAILYYYGVHKMLFSMLDARAERIREELDEARRLREEAQRTFAEFERKRGDVDQQVAEIVEHAKKEAENAAVRAKDELEATVERRLRGAEEQIAMAEASAVREVKDKAVAVAVAAAREIMQQNMSDETVGRLTDEAIQKVGEQLH